MKILITMLLTFLVAGAAYAYTPPDSCLKMIWPNDYDILTNTGSVNPDSIKADSCIGSPTYGKWFAKRYFELKFTSYPFSNAIPNNELRRVSDLREDIPGLKQQFQELEEEFGVIYFIRFWGTGNYPDSTWIQSGNVTIIFENYQEINSLSSVIKSNIDSLIEIHYIGRASNFLTDIEESAIKNLNKISTVNDIIYLNSNGKIPISKIKIFSIKGALLYEDEFNEFINVSFLSHGIYFLNINGQFYKFLK
jgi:hypothetical protein